MVGMINSKMNKMDKLVFLSLGIAFLIVVGSIDIRKVYKSKAINNGSSLRTVTIFPGNREVAGCLYFSGGNF